MGTLSPKERLDQLGLPARDLDAIIRRAVSAYRRRVGFIGLTDYEDQVQFAWVQAIQALDRFDPARGVDFKAFIRRRISGSIVDYLRTHQWNGKRKAKRPVHQRDRVIDGFGELDPMDLFPSRRPLQESEDQAELKDLARCLVDRISDCHMLPDSSRIRYLMIHIVNLRLQEMTLLQIGKSVGVSESRMCQANAVLREWWDHLIGCRCRHGYGNKVLEESAATDEEPPLAISAGRA